ncbi:hypothetical protein AB0K21_21900 [Streptosporangium sp. NPDC049248]|uniref:hypothetical protein n=1 Tax=Streptosporangium sp. NPDC049248 TaxID=3155651 RepID=UPI003429E200
MPTKAITELHPGSKLYIPYLLERDVYATATVIEPAIPGSDTDTWGVLVTYDYKPTGQPTMLWLDNNVPVPASNDVPAQVCTLMLPTFPGLTLLGQIDFYDGPESCDITGVWRNDTTGRLYHGDEWAGLSLTVDPLTSEDLIPCTPNELEAHLNMRLNAAEWMNDRAPFAQAVTTLMDTVRKATAKPDTATLDFPTFPGLELVGSVDFASTSEEVAHTGVWRDTDTGTLYYGSDYYALWMGMPSRPCLERHELTEATPDDVEWYLNDRLARVEGMDDSAPCVAAIAKLMDLVRNL